ncbi:MAG: hypothetical protein WCZ19_05675 [Acholeplasma sp.]
MLQDAHFKIIKDKKLRSLYQNVYTHLSYIDHLHTKDDLLAYQKLFKAYKNGYTSNNEMFKNLLKSQLAFPYIHIDWIGVFIDARLDYIQTKTLKRLDNLLKYAELTSKFGFLYLITDQQAKHHLSIINNLSKIDVLSYILLNDDTLKSKNLLHYPKQLIEDFGIEYSVDDQYMKNEKYISLWEFIHFKVKAFITSVEPMIHQFNSDQLLLINLYLKLVNENLKTKRVALIKHYEKIAS